MNKIIVYHGSNKIIKNPDSNFNNNHNDLGSGFYLCSDKNLSKIWCDGIQNKYELDLNNLKILDLTKNKNISYFITCILNNRLAFIGRRYELIYKYFNKSFNIDISDYDVIISYRADDTNYKVISDFLNNRISLGELEYFFKNTESRQIILKTEKAIKNLKFINYSYIDYNQSLNLRKQEDLKLINFYDNINELQFITSKFMLQLLKENNNE